MNSIYLSEFKMLTTYHKDHWTSFSEIWPTVVFSSGWWSLTRKVLCLRYLSVLFEKWGEISVREMRRHFISWTEHLNTSGITPHGTDSLCIKPITLGHPIPKISTPLTIFWGGAWKTEFVKTIHRQERTSSEEKSDGFQKKCSIELWVILMFELLLCCHTAVRCMERT